MKGKKPSKTDLPKPQHPFDHALNHQAGHSFKKPFENALYQSNVIMPSRVEAQKAEVA